MKTVILDAGHGIDTHGKRSPVWNDGTELFEWEFNRNIVKRIAERLESLDIPYHILVPEDRDILLTERVARVNIIYSKDPSSYLISIHANAGGGRGWEAFTSIGETMSDKYAEIIYKSARETLPEEFPIRTCGLDGDSDKESQFYILRKSHCPAILTENLFMDTEADCRYIMSQKGRNTIVDLHLNAILQINDL